LIEKRGLLNCCAQHYANDARLQVEHSNMLSRGWHVITRAQPEWWHFNRGTTYWNVPRASVLHLFCRMTNYEHLKLWNSHLCLKSLDYNVVMTFRFNNNNNITVAYCVVIGVL